MVDLEIYFQTSFFLISCLIPIIVTENPVKNHINDLPFSLRKNCNRKFVLLFSYAFYAPAHKFSQSYIN